MASQLLLAQTFQADTREHCIESAQQVYDRLMLRTPNEPLLPFDTLALLAKDEDDNIDVEKAKFLIKSFRPDRDGKLSKLDFVKSVDSIYKSIKLLSANISNSSQIDSAVEGIFNVVFYAILAAITLAMLDVDPFQLFFSLSSVLLVFAFAFGNSRYVQYLASCSLVPELLYSSLYCFFILRQLQVFRGNVVHPRAGTLW